MKGATTDPSASIINPPKILIRIIKGANQIFFRTFKNNHSSEINSIVKR